MHPISTTSQPIDAGIPNRSCTRCQEAVNRERTVPPIRRNEHRKELVRRNERDQKLPSNHKRIISLKLNVIIAYYLFQNPLFLTARLTRAYPSSYKHTTSSSLCPGHPTVMSDARNLDTDTQASQLLRQQVPPDEDNAYTQNDQVSGPRQASETPVEFCYAVYEEALVAFIVDNGLSLKRLKELRSFIQFLRPGTEQVSYRRLRYLVSMRLNRMAREKVSMH